MAVLRLGHSDYRTWIHVSAHFKPVGELPRVIPFFASETPDVSVSIRNYPCGHTKHLGSPS